MGTDFPGQPLRGWTGTAAENDRQMDAQIAEKTPEAGVRRWPQVAAFAGEKGALEQCLTALNRRSPGVSRCRLLDTGTAYFLEGWVPVPDEAALAGQLAPVRLLLGDRGPGGGGLPPGAHQASRAMCLRSR